MKRPPHDSDTPTRVDDLRGRVVRRRVGRGSKSEREALCIATAVGEFVLRRKGGPSYGDDELERYCGKTISCRGVIVTRTLLAERIRVVDDE